MVICIKNNRFELALSNFSAKIVSDADSLVIERYTMDNKIEFFNELSQLPSYPPVTNAHIQLSEYRHTAPKRFQFGSEFFLV